VTELVSDRAGSQLDRGEVPETYHTSYGGAQCWRQRQGVQRRWPGCGMQPARNERKRDAAYGHVLFLLQACRFPDGECSSASKNVKHLVNIKLKTFKIIHSFAGQVLLENSNRKLDTSVEPSCRPLAGRLCEPTAGAWCGGDARRCSELTCTACCCRHLKSREF
jgi:hypothetical protein